METYDFSPKECRVLVAVCNGDFRYLTKDDLSIDIGNKSDVIYHVWRRRGDSLPYIVVGTQFIYFNGRRNDRCGD